MFHSSTLQVQLFSRAYMRWRVKEDGMSGEGESATVFEEIAQIVDVVQVESVEL